MKKNQITQLINLLSYFADTIQNPSGLTALRMVLISGKNKYPIDIEIKNAEGHAIYHIPLVGKKVTVKPDGFLEMIQQQAILYDGMELSFHERGGGKRITADDRSVKISTIDSISKEKKFWDFTETSHSAHGISKTRDYYIRVDEAAGLLKAIGILDEKNKVRNDKIRKYNQIDRFVELADPIIQEYIQKKETIRILDCACGKSYLSFVLNYYIREKLHHSCEFLGLDWSESVIDSSRELANQLHYTNMKFQQCDLSLYKPSNFKPSICMSLHACDTATDLAIYTGIRSGSSAILCVPCCQKELLNSDYSIPPLENNILRHGLLKARFSDILTDAMRVLIMEAHGYETTVLEYISPLDSPKNIMIKGRFTGKNNKESAEEYQILKKKYHCDITLGKFLENNIMEYLE